MKISPYPDMPLLLVDDEEAWLNSLRLTLRAGGITNIECRTDGRRLMDILAARPYAALVLDLIMPHCKGDELLPGIVREYPDMPVIVITGMDQVETAVRCMKLGAFDYQTKVAEENRLFESIRRAIDFGQLKRENSALKEHFLKDTLDHPEAFAAIITRNKAMRSIFQYMEAIAGTREPVLITGETGTGKELVARALHTLSGRPGDFVAVNIAGLDETVFSDTLFGHVKGAFTGAGQARDGLVAKAAGGTLFIDEIGDLAPAAQTKLLRLIQEREFLPLGADMARRTDARLIFATHKTIDEMRASPSFRQDLFFRLRAHHIHLPPLRERLADDLPSLTAHFLKEAAETQGKTLPSPPPELITLLGTYHFPGNIRELRSMIFDAVSRHGGGTMSLEPFKAFIGDTAASRRLPATGADNGNPFTPLPALPTLKEAGNLLVAEALRRADNNQSIAARLLGISRQALSWRLKNNPAPGE